MFSCAYYCYEFYSVLHCITNYIIDEVVYVYKSTLFVM